MYFKSKNVYEAIPSHLILDKMLPQDSLLRLKQFFRKLVESGSPALVQLHSTGLAGTTVYPVQLLNEIAQENEFSVDYVVDRTNDHSIGCRVRLGEPEIICCYAESLNAETALISAASTALNYLREATKITA